LDTKEFGAMVPQIYKEMLYIMLRFILTLMFFETLDERVKWHSLRTCTQVLAVAFAMCQKLLHGFLVLWASVFSFGTKEPGMKPIVVIPQTPQQAVLFQDWCWWAKYNQTTEWSSLMATHELSPVFCQQGRQYQPPEMERQWAAVTAKLWEIVGNTQRYMIPRRMLPDYFNATGSKDFSGDFTWETLAQFFQRQWRMVRCSEILAAAAASATTYVVTKENATLLRRCFLSEAKTVRVEEEEDDEKLYPCDDASDSDFDEATPEAKACVQTDSYTKVDSTQTKGKERLDEFISRIEDQYSEDYETKMIPVQRAQPSVMIPVKKQQAQTQVEKTNAKETKEVGVQFKIPWSLGETMLDVHTDVEGLSSADVGAQYPGTMDGVQPEAKSGMDPVLANQLGMLMQEIQEGVNYNSISLDKHREGQDEMLERFQRLNDEFERSRDEITRQVAQGNVQTLAFVKNSLATLFEGFGADLMTSQMQDLGKQVAESKAETQELKKIILQLKAEGLKNQLPPRLFQKYKDFMKVFSAKVMKFSSGKRIQMWYAEYLADALHDEKAMDELDALWCEVDDIQDEEARQNEELGEDAGNVFAQDKIFRSAKDIFKVLKVTKGNRYHSQSCAIIKAAMDAKRKGVSAESRDPVKDQKYRTALAHATAYVLMHFTFKDGNVVFVNTPQEAFDIFCDDPEVYEKFELEEFSDWLQANIVYTDNAVFIKSGYEIEPVESAYELFLSREIPEEVEKIEEPRFDRVIPKMVKKLKKPKKVQIVEAEAIETSRSVTEEPSISFEQWKHEQWEHQQELRKISFEQHKKEQILRKQQWNRENQKPVVQFVKANKPPLKLVAMENPNDREVVQPKHVGVMVRFKTPLMTFVKNITEDMVGQTFAQVKNLEGEKQWDKMIPRTPATSLPQLPHPEAVAPRQSTVPVRTETQGLSPIPNKEVRVIGVDRKEHVFIDGQKLNDTQKLDHEALRTRYNNVFGTRVAPIALGTSGMTGEKYLVKLMAAERFMASNNVHVLQYLDFVVFQKAYTMLFRKPQAVDAVVAAVMEIEQYQRDKYFSPELGVLEFKYASLIIEAWRKQHPKGEQQDLSVESRVSLSPSVPVMPIHRVVLTTTKGSYEANFVAIQQHQETNSGKRFVVFATATYLHIDKLDVVRGEASARAEFVNSYGAPVGPIRVPIVVGENILTFYMETAMPCLPASRFNFDNIAVGASAVYQWHDGEGVKTSHLGYVQNTTKEDGVRLVHTNCNINNFRDVQGDGCCGGVLLLSVANRAWMPAAFHCLYDSKTGHNIAQMLPSGQIQVSQELKSLFWQL
jgi:hypothetical protein